jgi:flagellar hook assembly protein FlgD
MWWLLAKIAENYDFSGGLKIETLENYKSTTKYSLSQNYPNPFNPSTKIIFNIPYQGSMNDVIDLSVFNLKGQKITTLVNSVLSAGSYRVDWDGKNNLGNPVPSGIYFYILRTASFQTTRKMMLIR